MDNFFNNILQPLSTLKQFNKDNRTHIFDLYSQYFNLLKEYGWEMEILYTIEEQSINIPSLLFKTQNSGMSFWCLSGVHGEESAGPIAVSQSISNIGELGKKIPMVVMPLLNPLGYVKGWRYPNEYRDWKKGQSVSDSEHLLPKIDNLNQPRYEKPSSLIANKVTAKALEKIEINPPLINIDHHEDEALKESYVYSQGKLGVNDPAALEVVNILSKNGITIVKSGITRFGEPVVNGVVTTKEDGSIDELLAKENYLLDGKQKTKKAAITSLVVETPTIDVDLKIRINAHKEVIKNYERLFEITKNIS